MLQAESSSISTTRIRIGVIFIIIWWIPFWALSPYIANIIDPESAADLTAVITAIIMIIQTIIGFIGIFLAGGEIKQMLKDNPKKQVFKKFMHILWHGSI